MTNESTHYDQVVLGGGITGLSAAYYAKSRDGEHAPSRRVCLLEAGPTLGGKIRSEQVDVGLEAPVLLEWSADSMLSTKPEGLELVQRLGLESEVIETARERQVYMLRRNRLVAMPEGLQLVIPKRIWPFVKSPLFSWRGKLHMACEVFRPRRVTKSDESIGSFIRRRLGQEALDLLAEPILSGIYSADPERQSVMATFPQLSALEEQYGSLIRGALRSQTEVSTGDRKKSLFVSFRGGMQTLVDGLSSALGEDAQCNTEVLSIHKEGDRFRLALKDRAPISADKVILTTPAHRSAALLSEMAPKASTLLRDFRRTSSASAYLLYAREDVPLALRGYGILVPKVERRQINAVTWVSSKLEGRAPSSHLLFRTFLGGERAPEMMQHDDAELLRVATREIASLHGIRKPPVYARVFRSHSGNPQYDVGHLAKVAQIEQALPQGLIVTGCAMRGVGIPDCIKQGKASAELASLR